MELIWINSLSWQELTSVIGRTKRRRKDAEGAVWKCWKAAGWPLPHWDESEEKPVFYTPPHGAQDDTAHKEKWNKVEESILPMTFALRSGRLTSSPGLQQPEEEERWDSSSCRRTHWTGLVHCKRAKKSLYSVFYCKHTTPGAVTGCLALQTVYCKRCIQLWLFFFWIKSNQSKDKLYTCDAIDTPPPHPAPGLCFTQIQLLWI